MFNRRRKHRRRLDAATPAVRRPRFRRLAVESMESRLLLTGNQFAGGNLDDSIYNLDSLGNSYVVISQGDVAPPAITDNDSAPAIDLPPTNNVPPTIVLTGSSGVSLNGLYDSLYGSDYYSRFVGTSQGSGTTTTIGHNLDSITSLIGAHNLPNLQPPQPLTWDADVINSGDFNRDGYVNAADYLVWRDSFGTSFALPDSSRVMAYNNWRANFGTSVVEFIHERPLGSSLVFHADGVLDSPSIVSIDGTQPGKLSLGGDTSTAALNFSFDSQAGAFTIGNLATGKFDLVAQEGGSLSFLNETSSSIELVVGLGAAVIEKIADADIATTSPSLIGGIDGSNNLVAAPAPNRVEAPAARPSNTEEKLDRVVDDLLAEDTIIVSQPDDTSDSTIVDTTTPDVGTSDLFGAESSSGNLTEGASPLVDASQDAGPIRLAEGGMISIDALLAAAGGDAESLMVDAGAELTATDGSTGTLGELSRVAVMELIEGQAEPGAAESSDHVMVVAQRDADPLDAFRVVAHQAGVAIALATPAGPTYLASIATAAVDAASRAIATLVGNHLAAEAAGELAADDDARHAAFSELGGNEDNSETTATLDGPHGNRWLAATPLVLAIASERALAIRNRRRNQRDPASSRPAK